MDSTEQHQDKFHISYSEALKTQDFNYNARLEKLENVMDNLMNMMNMLMTKLCK